MQRVDSLEKTLMLGKTEGKRRGQQRIRQLQCIWPNSRRQWRTEKPGMLHSMGLQRVGHDWVTEQWHPTPVLLPGKSHGRRSLEGCSPWGRWGSDRTEWLHFQFSLSCIGEGNGNPLQCSCLENPKDGGAWWAAVYGVAQSRTQLKQLSRLAAEQLNNKNNKAFLRSLTMQSMTPRV